MNNNNNINTFFKIKFPISIQNNTKKKFNYATFLTRNHDTYKYRLSTYIDLVDINNIYALNYGQFKKNDLNWIIYIPRITNFNKDENIINNEIFANFIKNLQTDVGTNTNIYIVLANIYESLPTFTDNTLDFTFYKLFMIKNISNSININVHATFCKLTRKLSDNNNDNSINCQNFNKFLTFLNDDIKVKDNYLLKQFLEKFSYLIVSGFYNMLINNFEFFYKNINNEHVKETKYNNKIKTAAVDLINRCKIDNNPSFLYSNLGKNFVKTISQCFSNDDNEKIKTLLFIIVKSK